MDILPALIRNTPDDPFGPVQPIIEGSPCLNCHQPVQVVEHDAVVPGLGLNVTIVGCQACGMFAIVGDDVWVNANACEGKYPGPFLVHRAGVMAMKRKKR